MLKDDPVIDQIRATRSLISARFNHDPKKIVEYYIKLQEEYRKRLVNLAEVEEDYQKNLVNSEAVTE
ncbi:hypothetical protein L0337_40535 [candidate division KSB1 bacterium]|nr:hypothetical protein [candidate division KSB1 bacterium]